MNPDWVYCEYNSVSDLEKERESSGEYGARDQEPSFGSPEEQVLHFLARAGRPGWKWMSVSVTGLNVPFFEFFKIYLYPLYSTGTSKVSPASS